MTAILSQLRKLISHTHLAEEKGKITYNTKNRISTFYNTKVGNLRRLSNYDYSNHVSELNTFFGQGAWSSKQTHTLCNIDIDCHESGTLEGAQNFALWLKTNYFPGLFYETSTSGHGVHCYLIVDKMGEKELVNKAITHLQSFLRQFTSQFEISGVETKGHLPILTFKDGKLEKIKSGSNFKLPRGNFTETYSCSYKDLLSLEIKVAPKISVESGSCCLINKEDLKESEKVAKVILAGHSVAFTESDLAQFVAILVWKTKNPNDDNSMPTELFKVVTTNLYHDGLFERGWDSQRHKAMRDFLSDNGFIEWISESYTRPSKRGAGDGIAAQWCANSRLLSLFSEHTHTLLRLNEEDRVCVRPICVGWAGGRSVSYCRTLPEDCLIEFSAA